jgi:hypothetical protein
MQQWDQDFVDEEVEGFFEFDSDGYGSFQFDYVRGHIDYRFSTWDGKSRMEFSWDGCDEMDPAQGRGWAIAEGDEIIGELYFHGGDESKSALFDRYFFQPSAAYRGFAYAVFGRFG